MIPDVKINGTSMLSLGWLRETVDFPTPKSQTNTVVVPGRNSPIRFTEALGRVSYQPRSFEITLTMLGTRAEYDSMVSEAVNRYAGQLVQVICSEEPDLYYIGTIEAEPSYDPYMGKGVLLFSCSDGDAYRYHVMETSVSRNGSGTVTLVNDYMPVVPVITTTAETTLTWMVGSDSFHKTLSAGTWEIPELELAPGNNSVTVSGSGLTTFQYREGRL
ncbi:MAG: hypothetical protein ACI3XQ_09530 [Eubacteriales bacterium]